MIKEILIFFEIVPLAFNMPIPASFSLVEAPLLIKLPHYIFIFFPILKSYPSYTFSSIHCKPQVFHKVFKTWGVMSLTLPWLPMTCWLGFRIRSFSSVRLVAQPRLGSFLLLIYWCDSCLHREMQTALPPI